MTAGSNAAASRPDDGDRTDAQLLADHVAGDPQAFATLVRRHRDRLWGVALRTLGDPDDAADALQDALVSAHRGAAGYRGDAKVTTWLHRIVVNACVDLARRRQARPARSLTEDPAADDVVDPRDPLTERETAHEVLAALRTLSPDQAAAVVLVDIEGHRVDEAAEILGVPVGTVKSRCARGRAHLAVLLAHLAPRGNLSVAGSVPSPTQPRSEEVDEP